MKAEREKSEQESEKKEKRQLIKGRKIYSLFERKLKERNDKINMLYSKECRVQRHGIQVERYLSISLSLSISHRFISSPLLSNHIMLISLSISHLFRYRYRKKTKPQKPKYKYQYQRPTSTSNQPINKSIASLFKYTFSRLQKPLTPRIPDRLANHEIPRLQQPDEKTGDLPSENLTHAALGSNRHELRVRNGFIVSLFSRRRACFVCAGLLAGCVQTRQVDVDARAGGWDGEDDVEDGAGRVAAYVADGVDVGGVRERAAEGFGVGEDVAFFVEPGGWEEGGHGSASRGVNVDVHGAFGAVGEGEFAGWAAVDGCCAGDF